MGNFIVQVHWMKRLITFILFPFSKLPKEVKLRSKLGKCRYYGNTKQGYYTDEKVGEACVICGG